jgi:ADP-heptose:LPS heptosyltransferase
MRLREVAGLELVSLQLDAAPAELAATGAVDWRSADIHQLATRVMTLDLVITVDTMTAHLAGALGRPVWTLLPAACDWRWMEDRDDSPWYPSMRLFRQRQAGHWQEVLDNIIAELTRGP